MILGTQRRHPRVPIDLPCVIERRETGERWPARARAMAREGVGLRLMDIDQLDLVRGDDVKITLSYSGRSLPLSGAVRWLCRDEVSPMQVGIHFKPAFCGGFGEFSRWVERAYLSHRRQSELLAAELVWRRQASLREIQLALDRQQRDGGFLTSLLLEIRAADP